MIDQRSEVATLVYNAMLTEVNIADIAWAISTQTPLNLNEASAKKLVEGILKIGLSVVFEEVPPNFMDISVPNLPCEDLQSA